MLKRKITVLSLVVIFINSTIDIYASSRNDSIKRVVSVIEEAMLTKQVDLLEGIAAPDFSVSIANMPDALGFANRVVQYEEDFKSISILSNREEANGDISVLVQLYSAEADPTPTNILLDNQFRVKYLDYFDQKYGVYRDKPAELEATIPFEVIDGSIFITLTLNDADRPLRFLFDTGADGMATTTKLAEELGISVDVQRTTSVVGANRDTPISRNNTVHMGSFSVPEQSIALFEDMGGMDGIIGLNLAKMYILDVDFDQLQIKLYDLGDYTPPSNYKAVPISVPDGLVSIPCELDLNGKSVVQGNFVLDTGARFNLVVFSPFVRKHRLLLSGFKIESEGSMVSMGHTSHIFNGKADLFSFGPVSITEMPITLQASSGNSDWNPEAAGSIGIQLASKYNFTIDLVKKQLYMSER